MLNPRKRAGCRGGVSGAKTDQYRNWWWWSSDVQRVGEEPARLEPGVVSGAPEPEQNNDDGIPGGGFAPANGSGPGAVGSTAGGATAGGTSAA